MKHLKLFEQFVNESEDDSIYNMNGIRLTLPQFQKKYGKIDFTKAYSSPDAKFAYIKFYKFDNKYFGINTYGPPGFVDEVYFDKLPKDIQDKLNDKSSNESMNYNPDYNEFIAMFEFNVGKHCIFKTTEFDGTFVEEGPLKRGTRPGEYLIEDLLYDMQDFKDGLTNFKLSKNRIIFNIGRTAYDLKFNTKNEE